MKKYYYVAPIAIILLLLLSICVWFITQKMEKSTRNTLSEIKSDCLFIIDKQKKTIQVQKKTIQVLDTELSKKQKVTVSFYHPMSRGINSDTDPTNTAIMVLPTVGKTVAISDELFKVGWLGQKVYIDGFGVFVCEDRMSSKIEGKCIDICVNSEEKALQLGKRYNILAVRLM